MAAPDSGALSDSTGPLAEEEPWGGGGGVSSVGVGDGSGDSLSDSDGVGLGLSLSVSVGRGEVFVGVGLPGELLPPSVGSPVPGDVPSDVEALGDGEPDVLGLAESEGPGVVGVAPGVVSPPGRSRPRGRPRAGRRRPGRRWPSARW